MDVGFVWKGFPSELRNGVDSTQGTLPLCWFWNVISLRYPLSVHERAYGSFYKSIIAYINDDFYW